MGRPFGSTSATIDSARLLNAGFLTLLRLEELFGQRNILNAEHRALHDSVLLQVDDHFLDDRRRNGERIADVSAAARLDQRIDAYQLTFRVDQRAAAVARIDRCVGLDERLEAELARSAFRLRPLALTMPAVIVLRRSNGLPMASTHSPKRGRPNYPSGS